MDAKPNINIYENHCYNNKGIIFLIFILITGMVMMLGASIGEAAPGENIFKQSCGGCHTIGGGDMVGPDLKGITDIRAREWLISYSMEAADMRAQGDPIALELSQKWSIAMPNTGLSKEESTAVMAYLEAQKGTRGMPAAAPKELLPQGDAAKGRDLYIGAVSFRNGGGSCLACHDAGGIGVLGGGTLGPDLTKIYPTYGEAALGSVLAAPSSPFPTMKPIYDTQPLTKEEIVNLIAFFAATADEPSSQGETQFAMFGLGGTLMLLIISGLFWKGRIQNVRRSLIEQATQKANRQIN
jgi:mono/diheme cytochrome c family protein